MLARTAIFRVAFAGFKRTLSNRLLRKLWEAQTVITVVTTLYGVGLAAMSMSPPAYALIKWCVSIAAVLAVVRTIHWIIAFQATSLDKVVSTTVFAALLTIGWAVPFLLTSERERIAIEHEKIIYPVTQPSPLQGSTWELLLMNHSNRTIEDLRYSVKMHVQRLQLPEEQTPLRDLGVIPPYAVLQLGSITVSDEPEDVYEISYLTTIGEFSDMLYFRRTASGLQVKRVGGLDGSLKRPKEELLGVIPPVR